MRRRPLLVAALACLAAVPAAAQAGPRAGTLVPRGILEDIARGHDAGGGFGNADSLARYTRQEQRDLNGDGRPELVVRATGRLCGATGNCARWVYAARPEGGHRRLLHAGGYELRFLPTRTRGWPDAEESEHVSALQTYRARFAFDGERYAWVATELLGGEGHQVRWQLSLPLPPPGREGEPRRATLRTPLVIGGGVRVSAAYQACAAAAATPGRLCGEPRLELAWAPLPGRPARQPWADAPELCFDLTVVPWEGPEERKGRMCAQPAAPGTSAPRPGLSLSGTPEQWDAIARVQSFRLAGGGAELRFEGDLRDGVQEFVGAVYSLNGMNQQR